MTADTSAENKSTVIFGAMPNLELEVEEFEHLTDTKVTGATADELCNLYKSVLNSYKLYYKTRPSAAKASVRR